MKLNLSQPMKNKSKHNGIEKLDEEMFTTDHKLVYNYQQKDIIDREIIRKDIPDKGF